jgi:putative FmdB family regulatory protein
MPIYEYRCKKCDAEFEEYLSTSTKPAPPCPKCKSKSVERLWSRINTEWMPSDVAWDRVGRSWD